MEGFIEFVAGDMRDTAALAISPWDIVISNPPYIADDELTKLDQSVRDHEPRLALSGSADGLEFYRALGQVVRPHLVAGGKIFLEIGATQGVVVQKLLSGNGWQDVRVELDYAGLPRNIIAVNPG